LTGLKTLLPICVQPVSVVIVDVPSWSSTSRKAMRVSPATIEAGAVSATLLVAEELYAPLFTYAIATGT